MSFSEKTESRYLNSQHLDTTISSYLIPPHSSYGSNLAVHMFYPTSSHPKALTPLVFLHISNFWLTPSLIFSLTEFNLQIACITVSHHI